MTNTVTPFRRATLSAMSVADGIVHYLDRLQRRARSINTLNAYRGDLCQFAAFLERLGQGDLVATVGQPQVSRWLDDLSAQGVSPRSQARKLSVLRGYFKHAMREGWIGFDPTADEAVRYRRARVVAPELDELHQVIDAIPRQGWKNLRDRALLRLALDTGARISELAGLDIPGSNSQSVLDLRRGLAHVVAKGGDVDTLPFNDATARMVEEWLVARTEVARAGHTALFVSNRGTRCSRGALHLICATRGEAVGLRLHMHLFRHRRGSMVIERCGDKLGQQFLRHESLSTTSQYGRHANNRTFAVIRQLADIDEERVACNG